MKNLTTMLLALFLIESAGSTLFAQNSDPRMMSIRFPQNGQFSDVPPGNLEYKNPNQSPMIFYLRNQVVEVLPNFRVHPSNFTQSEVPITRGSNPDILFASSNSVRSSPFFISEGVYVSVDGGNNWFGSDSCKSAPITDHLGDPGPGIGPDGRFYMSFLGYSGGMKAAYSTNFGNTWSASAILQTGSVDKNHTAVDNVPGSPYLGRAYVTWSDFNQSAPSATVSYTTNGGVNWSTYQHINTNASGHYSQGVNGAVGPDGTIYVAWQSPILGSPYTGDFIGLGKSTNGGVTWTYNNNIYDCNGVRGELQFNGTQPIRVNDFPWMAIDNTGGARNGHIYIVTGEKSLAPAGNDPDIVLHYSADGGTTWSAGIRVNQDPINNGQFQYMPAVCVGGDGAINVVYYDTRNATLSGGRPDSAQVYISRSLDGGLTFEDILVSDHRFKPKPISGLATGYQGDYIGIVEANGTVFPYWCSDKSGIYQAWTTQVTFEPPCPIEPASNPNPPSGASGVSVNLAQLSWTNGAGANTNETYFGTNPTSLTLVQSGALASSWTIDPSYLPLSYNTHYYWKIVEVGDTCNSSASFSFTTIPDPNLVIDTVDVYPQNANYWTGTTTATAKTQVSLMNIMAAGEQAWAKFDVSSIPVGSTITSVSVNWYINTQNCPYFYINALPIDPVTATPSALYSAITGGVHYYQFSTCPPVGWNSVDLEGNVNADLAASIPSGWFALSFYEYESSTYYFTAQGWAEANKPYLRVNYYYIVPVELTSFTAVAANDEVELNWRTATETNNQGFQVERMDANGSFEQLGYVAGFGTTTEPKAYSFIDSELKAGSYTYRLKQIDFDGTFTYSEEVNVDVEIPLEFALEQNYPNPFNPSTTIKYSIAEDGFVTLAIYNMLGEEVTTLVNTQQKAGRYEVNFNAAGLSSGVYVYRIEATNYTASKKLMLMK